MARLRRSRKAGLPPGTLVHIGQQKVERPRIHVMQYAERSLQEQHYETLVDWSPTLGDRGVTWVDIGGVHDVDLIERVGHSFSLHPLTLEDIVNTEQRAKLDEYDMYLYIVLKMLYPDGAQGDILSEQVSLVLGRQYVLTFQENGRDVFDNIRTRLRTDKGKIRKCGADYLLYSLIDAIADHYFVVVERLGETIELLEDELMMETRGVSLGRIQAVKKNLLSLRRVVWPVREVVNGLQREEQGLIQPATRVYLRDVYDHTVQIMETIDSLRDLTGGMLDIYLSSTSHRMASVMKVLTVITTIFMPLTFIAGVYGMNFQYMPELTWRWGYPTVLFVMASVGIAMVFFFRKKKWL